MSVQGNASPSQLPGPFKLPFCKCYSNKNSEWSTLSWSDIREDNSLTTDLMS